MELWEQLMAQISDAKVLYEKYSKENPILEERNKLLRKESEEKNREIAVKTGTIEDLNAEIEQKSKQSADKISETNKYIQDKIDDAKIKVDKTNEECATRIALLDEREAKLVEREEDVAKNEKVNVAKYEALEEATKKLQEQSKEIEDAAKVLNTKAVDLNHEENVIKQRSDELDAKEARLIKDDESISERITKLQAAEKQARVKLANSEDLFNKNDLVRIELEKREAFLKTKEKDIKTRELKLESRTKLFVDSLKQGKMV